MGEAEEPNQEQEELDVPLWLKFIFLVFVIGSAWGIYCYGMILYLVFLLPFALIMSIVASVYGLISGEREDKVFHLMMLTMASTLLAAMFNSASSSIFRDDD